MDAEGRATQDAKAENNYTTKALPSLNAKLSAAKMNSKGQHALVLLYLMKLGIDVIVGQFYTIESLKSSTCYRLLKYCSIFILVCFLYKYPQSLFDYSIN